MPHDRSVASLAAPQSGLNRAASGVSSKADRSSFRLSCCSCVCARSLRDSWRNGENALGSICAGDIPSPEPKHTRKFGDAFIVYVIQTAKHAVGCSDCDECG